MNAPQPLEVSLVFNLRRKFPSCSYSELLDAFQMARTVMPEGKPADLEAIASYILGQTYAIAHMEPDASEIQDAKPSQSGSH